MMGQDDDLSESSPKVQLSEREENLNQETDFLIQENEQGGPPEDKYGLVYGACVLLGIGLLFPFNVFISANDFWAELWAFPFVFFIVIVYNYPGIAALIFNVKYGPKIPLTWRIVVCLGVDIVTLALIPVVTSINAPDDSDSSGDDYEGLFSLIFCLVAVFLCGGFTAMLFGTVLSFVSIFPAEYTGAIMSGNGVAGVIVGVSRIVTILVAPDKIQLNADLYFGVAVLVMSSCLVAYFWMIKQPFVVYHMKNLQEEKFKEIDDDESGEDFEEFEADVVVYEKDDTHWQPVLKKIWKPAAMVFFTFFLTLSIFPGFVLLVPDTDWSDKWTDWYGVLIVFTFQVFDWIGRTCPKWFILFTPKTLWIPVYGRVIFFPLFFLCVEPRVIGWPWSFVFMALFALSNGYCGTLCMMFGPMEAQEHQRETAAAVMSFFLNFGILIAGHFSIVLLYIVQGPSSLPFYHAPTPSPSPFSSFSPSPVPFM